jgi:hypothetical protein
MLRDGQPNPLAVHGLREMDTCAPHLVKVPFELKASRKILTDWIWENLEGRFWFGDIYFINETSGNIDMSVCAAFEIPGEATMFALCLSQFNTHQY